MITLGRVARVTHDSGAGPDCLLGLTHQNKFYELHGVKNLSRESRTCMFLFHLLRAEPNDLGEYACIEVNDPAGDRK